MSKKLRYIMVGLCFLIFLILAPILVLFVRGVTYEDGNPKLKPTGILAIETEPDNALVSLNGAESTTTPASIRFLKPGDYTITITKEGYFPWQKKLTVIERKVTWASPNPNKITLLKNDEAPTVIATGVQKFIVLHQTAIAYTTNNSVVILSGENFTETTSLPIQGQSHEITASPDGSLLILRGREFAYAIQTKTHTIQDIRALAPEGSILEFISNTEGIILTSGTVNRVNFVTKASALLFKNVENFAVADDRIYVLKNTNGHLQLESSLVTQPENPQIIVEKLPQFKTTKIFINPGREALLLGDNNLYRINTMLEELARNVQIVWFDQTTSSLTFTRPGELNFFNFDENKIKLIARSSEPFTYARLRRDLNYAFYVRSGKLEAIELDDRDRQNTYPLGNVTNADSFSFIDERRIAIQDGETLTLLTVR